MAARGSTGITRTHTRHDGAGDGVHLTVEVGHEVVGRHGGEDSAQQGKKRERNQRRAGSARGTIRCESLPIHDPAP